MPEATFDVSSNFSFIKINGSDFNLAVLKNFQKIIKNINETLNIKKIRIIGNFNSNLLKEDIFKK